MHRARKATMHADWLDNSRNDAGKAKLSKNSRVFLGTRGSNPGSLVRWALVSRPRTRRRAFELQGECPCSSCWDFCAPSRTRRCPPRPRHAHGRADGRPGWSAGGQGGAHRSRGRGEDRAGESRGAQRLGGHLSRDAGLERDRRGGRRARSGLRAVGRRREARRQSSARERRAAPRRPRRRPPVLLLRPRQPRLRAGRPRVDPSGDARGGRRPGSGPGHPRRHQERRRLLVPALRARGEARGGGVRTARDVRGQPAGGARGSGVPR